MPTRDPSGSLKERDAPRSNADAQMVARSSSTQKLAVRLVGERSVLSVACTAWIWSSARDASGGAGDGGCGDGSGGGDGNSGDTGGAGGVSIFAAA